jgi:prepilin-type N-terminal cleavage/methylation domain-containing protein
MVSHHSSLFGRGFRAKVSMNFTGKNSCRGFSLIELLIVLSLMALLTALSAPAVFSLSSSGRTNQAITSLAGALEIARQYAVAQNTYTWVAFSETTDASGQKLLVVAIVGSQDGTDPAAGSNSWSQYNYGPVPGPGLALVNKVITFPQVELQDAASFSSSQIPGLPDVQPPVSSGSNSVATSSSGFFTINLPGVGTQTFTQAIEFLPDGEARNGVGAIDVVDIDMQPVEGGGAVPNNKNVAVLRVNGLTGEAAIYRP